MNVKDFSYIHVIAVDISEIKPSTGLIPVILMNSHFVKTIIFNKNSVGCIFEILPVNQNMCTRH